MNSALKKNLGTIFKSSVLEDQTGHDITTKKLINSNKLKCALLFKEDGVLCGKGALNYLIKTHNKNIKIVWNFNDGDYIKRNTKVATIKGPGNQIVSIERILLNFIQRMSGIATLTNNYSKAIKNKKIKLLDTRKTTPGWRLIEKYCVKIGGGHNHRKNLSEMILIKDNHIAICGGVTKALKKIKNSKGRNVEIEIKSISQLTEALKFNIKRIMLDNLNIKEIKKAIKIIRKYPGIEIEASGGMTLLRIKQISSLDLDYISVGALTHSSKSLDISMNVEK